MTRWTPARARSIGFGVAVAAVSIQLGAAAVGSLFWPFGRDQGIFAWVGDAIVRGGAPFVDAWEQKGPATHYLYALAQVLFGRTMWGPRVVELALLTATAAVCVRVLGRRYGAPCAVATVAVVVGAELGLGYWNTAQPDGWGAMMWLIALCLAARAAEGQRWRRWAVTAGAFAGLAVLFKPTFAVMVVPLVALPVAARGWHVGRWRGAAVISGAVGVVVAGMLALAAAGALGAFIDIQLGFNPAVHVRARGRGVFDHLSALAGVLGGRGLVLPAIVIAAAAADCARRHRAMVLTLGASTAAALALVVVQNQYHAYHVAVVVAPVAVWTGLSASCLIARAERIFAARWPRAVAMLPGLIVVALVAWQQPRWNLDGWRAVALGTAPRDAYWERFGDPAGDFWFPADWHVARYLRVRTAPGDSIAVFSFDPSIYVLAGRPSASRFGFHYPLTATSSPSYARDRRRYVEDLRRASPAFVVVGSGDANKLVDEPSDVIAARFEAFDAWLRANYEPGAVVGRYRVWKRR